MTKTIDRPHLSLNTAVLLAKYIDHERIAADLERGIRAEREAQHLIVDELSARFAEDHPEHNHITLIIGGTAYTFDIDCLRERLEVAYGESEQIPFFASEVMR